MKLFRYDWEGGEELLRLSYQYSSFLAYNVITILLLLIYFRFIILLKTFKKMTCSIYK